MMVARADQQQSLDVLCSEVGGSSKISVLEKKRLLEINPLLRSDYAAAAMLDSAGQDIDVSALHQGFLKVFSGCQW